MNPESNIQSSEADEQEKQSTTSSGTSSTSSSFSEAHFVESPPSREFEDGKNPITPSQVQGESNVNVNTILQPPIAKRSAGTTRQLLLTSFKFENSLRNLVLSLSDSLDRMERAWQHKVLVKVSMIDENLAIYLTDYSPGSVSSTREFEYRNESSWLSAGENALLRQIMRRIYGQSQALPVAKIDYSKEHGELFEDVLRTQGGKEERNAFLDICLQHLPQWKFQRKRPSDEDPELDAKLKKVELLLKRAITSLDNDDYAVKQRKLIRQTANSIKYSKTMFDNKIKVHSLEDPSWPIVDFIFVEGWLLVQIILGPGWSPEELRIDSNGKDMHVVGSGKNPFQKYFTLPCEIDPQKVTARFEDFILQIKCTVPSSSSEEEK